MRWMCLSKIGDCFATSFLLVPQVSSFVSQGSCQCLNISECRLVANVSILSCIFDHCESILGIHHFKHSGFSPGIAHLCESKTLGGGLNALIERGQLIVRCGRLAVGFFEIGYEPSLRSGKRYASGIPADFALLHLVLR